MSKSKNSVFTRITKNLGRLTLAELEELSQIVDTLKEAKSKEVPKEVQAQRKKDELIRSSIERARDGRDVRIGYLEEKMINGFGPYLYFRYWQDGIHKSLYIGKKE